MSSNRRPAQERAIPLPEKAQWRRVHPITPLLEGWKVVTALFAFVVWQNAQLLGDAYEALNGVGSATLARVWPWVLATVLLALALVSLGLWLSWRMRSFAVDQDAVYLRTGVLNKQLRTARLPRIQSVDVVHPLLGRILGLGRLTVEVAGGGDSRVVIGFLRTSELQALRDQILSLAAGQQLRGDFLAPAQAGARPAGATVTDGVARGSAPSSPGGADGVAGYGAGQAAAADAGPDARGGTGADGVAPGAGWPQADAAPRGFADALSAKPLAPGLVQDVEHDLYEVDIKVLLGSMLRSGASLVFLLVLLGYGIAATVVLLSINASDEELRAGAVLSALLPVLTVPVAFGGYLWNRFDKAWRFRAAATPAGIRMRFGLTAETSSTLPPGRVHGVHLQQGPLWRGPDWWRVETSVAGRENVEASSNGVQNTGANVLLPVGVRDTALRALWLVVPDLGVPDPDAFLEEALGPGQVDGAAAGVTAGAPGGGAGPVQAASPSQAAAGPASASTTVAIPTAGFVGISPRGRVFSPFAWRREGIALTETCVVLRLGRWWRRTSVIPYERIQSLRVSQGPFARRRGLATIHLDMVDIAIARNLSNLDLAEAAAVAQVISERALRRRGEEQLDRWLQRATGDAPQAS